MQKVEMLKITEPSQLIDPAEVVVSQGVVLSAEPVLTPIGGSSRPRGALSGRILGGRSVGCLLCIFCARQHRITGRRDTACSDTWVSLLARAMTGYRPVMVIS